jgi:hypothetical protein
VGKRKGHGVLLLISLTAFGLSFISNNQDSYTLWFFAAFFVGVLDAYNQTLLNSIIGSEIEETSKAYSIRSCVQSLTFLAMMIFQSFIEEDFKTN